ncbi:MAG: hypothetical protein Q4F91_09540, partial [Sutterella sp.]|nr:hypothetical protein [Sutterella sp.]
MSKKIPSLTALTPVAAAIGLLFAAPAGAWYTQAVTNEDGSVYAWLNIAETTDTVDADDKDDDGNPLVRREITAADLEKITTAFRYWSGIIGNSVNKPVITLESYTDKSDNASAASTLADSGTTKLQAVVTGEIESTGEDASIDFDLPTLTTSWTWSTISILPRNHLEGDLPGTIIHELMHAYGLIDNTGTVTRETDGQTVKFSQFLGNSVYNSHLYDLYGTQATSGMPLATVTTDEALDASKNDSSLFQVIFSTAVSGITFRGDAVTQVLRGTDETGAKIYEGGITWTDDEDVVIYAADMTSVEDGTLVTATAANSYTGGLPINGLESLTKESEESGGSGGSTGGDDEDDSGDSGSSGTGEAEASGDDDASDDGDTSDGSDSSGSSGTTSAVTDMTVAAELSHIELQNSLMSHQNYRNWGTLMEAELALMEDLGFSIDRKKYFGTSVYSSGNTGSNAITITQPFWARENGEWVEGTASTQSLAVGVHVYGSVNDVTVAADQLANGAESIGVRVDGIANSVTVASGTTVSADGTNGLGIAFAYGRAHSLTLESGSTVTANGTGGRALSFDFGGNEMGDYIEYRGSYMRATMAKDSEGTYNGSWNNGMFTTTVVNGSSVMQDPLDAINGALMDSVTIAGTVEAASGEAIYISPNALVSKITIQNGASITGDIVSEWNACSTVTEAIDGSAYYYYLEAASTLYGDTRTTDDDGTIRIIPGVHAQALITKSTTRYNLLEPDGIRSLLALDTVPDLTTNLVFGDSEDFDFTYTGNITGANGIRLTFAEGVTTLSGTMTVLGGVISADAAVKGAATYNLTSAVYSIFEAQARVSDGSGFVQGALVNSGVLWSAVATGGSPTINGNYLQSGEGTIAVGVSTSGKLATVTVTGEARLASSDSSGSTETDTETEIETATLLTAASADETPVSVTLVPDLGYWADGATATVADGQNAIVNGDGTGVGTTMTWSNDLLSSISETLTIDETTGTVARKSGAYSSMLGSSASSGQRAVAAMLDANAGSATDTNAQNFIAALDYSDAAVGAAAMGEITGDAHISAVRAQFAVERLLDRTLARVPADAAVSGRHIWAQPFGGR